MIGKALRLLRVYHDLKLGELAKMLDISISYLSEIENGKKRPSLDIIEKYAQIFNTKPSAILFFSENVDDDSTTGKIKEKVRGNILAFLEAIEDAGTKQISP
ncbi:helix-turn-helix domain-containing protein [Methylosoma difficile]